MITPGIIGKRTVTQELVVRLQGAELPKKEKVDCCQVAELLRKQQRHKLPTMRALQASTPLSEDSEIAGQLKQVKACEQTVCITGRRSRLLLQLQEV